MKWLEPYIYKLNQEICNNGDEDTTFTYLYMLNDIVMEYAGKKYHTNMPSLKDSVGYSKANHIQPSKTWDMLVKNF